MTIKDLKNQGLTNFYVKDIEVVEEPSKKYALIIIIMHHKETSFNIAIDFSENTYHDMFIINNNAIMKRAKKENMDSDTLENMITQLKLDYKVLVNKVYG